MSNEKLPEGYYIIDGEVETHDCDMEDGRYCLYSPEDEPLLNLHDKAALIAVAVEHKRTEDGQDYYSGL
jgi:hypothetical protein